MMRFNDRKEAGQLLSLELARYKDGRDVLVLALPRGGVPVAHEIASVLHCPLDVLVVRKLGVPGHEEMAMGAIATGGIRLINPDIVSALGISPEAVEDVERKEEAELFRRERSYRGNRGPLDTRNKTIILVDDGIATGATMQAAIASLRQRRVRKIIVASPVAPRSVVLSLRRVADDVVTMLNPEDFGGVGRWYEDFSQTSDEEVQQLLEADHEVSLTTHLHEN
ncbi:MAG: phosphoribosyltransferase [Chthoniobacterales bacterium]|nr:phosphoribosyltransferase [Chthoniobacterales bacterium]